MIPSNLRPCLLDCLDAIAPQVDRIWVVNTTDEDLASMEGFSEHRWPDTYITELHVAKPGPNISYWWNCGLVDIAHEYQGAKKWDVAILNDDAIVPEGWFDVVSGTMRTMQVAASCSGGQGPMPVLQTVPGPVGIQNRLQGFAFILAGELGLRANEDIRWHFSDDYIDYESRKLGGMVMVPGYHVQHLYADQQVSPEMAIMCAEDAQKFHDLYNGAMPW